MYKTGDICPACATGTLNERIITEEFKYKGKRLSVPNYHIYRCDVCDEEFVSSKTLKGTEKDLTDFRRKVDGLLTSSEIKSIRNKLGKTQTQLAADLGLGAKTFARYENGQVTQNKSMDLLLRAIGSDPTMLKSLSRQMELKYEVINMPSVICCEAEPDALKYTLIPNKYQEVTNTDWPCNTNLPVAA